MRYVKILCVCVACFVMTGCSTPYLPASFAEALDRRLIENARALALCPTLTPEQACEMLAQDNDFLGDLKEASR